MEKVKNSILLLIIILVSVYFVSCKRTPRAKSDELVVNGKLTNATGRMIWLSELDGKTLHLMDSARLGSDGVFSFRIKTQSACFYLVSSRKNDYALLIGDKDETIMLTGDATQLSSTWNVKGSKETKLYLTYWDFSRKQLNRVDSLTILFRVSNQSPEYMATRIRLDSIFNAIMDKQRETATRFINENPGSLASLLVIDAKFPRLPLFNEVRDINYYKLLDSCLSITYKDNKLITDFHTRYQHILKRIKLHQVNKRPLPPGDLSPSFSPNR
jgi:hypothetical protein